ncbi:sigma 54-interacting transcriptional regulator [Methylobacterium indicum]|uniref:Sigma-54 dependent transcriptional regulator n=1 Tax=Methylobacterium indicum TaxID=1775910 RepID=A0A8H8X0M3_9HYPH|nr:sigma 54-interacting transcriptional regulator [Methylobacterium indicum]BCM87923.1 sigma-54 dependent transcriptional regulator [Methylobacterium indicum]
MKFYASDPPSSGLRRPRPALVDDPSIMGFLEALPDGAALVEIDGTIKFVNTRMQLLLNLAKGDLVGSDLAKHARTAGPILAKIATALHQLKRAELTGTLNSQRSVFASISILRTSDGAAYAALFTLRELTRQAKETAPDRFRFEADMLQDGAVRYVQTERLRALARRASTALERGSPVMLLGESGTGKTEFARTVGQGGSSAALPFVHVNCGLLSEQQFDIEMFGIEPGSALDPSTRGKPGYVEVADGGILFLDQVSDLSLAAQIKLVAFLESRTFSRVGSTQRRQTHINLVSATNQDIFSLIDARIFRKDLYYRLSSVVIEFDRLSGQDDLIKLLADLKMNAINQKIAGSLALSEGFHQKLLSYSYPGNIRELFNILDHAAALAGEVVQPEHFFVPYSPAAASPETSAPPAEAPPRSFKELVHEFETWLVEKSIAQNGSKRSAARALGIDVATLLRRTNRKI